MIQTLSLNQPNYPNYTIHTNVWTAWVSRGTCGAFGNNPGRHCQDNLFKLNDLLVPQTGVTRLCLGLIERRAPETERQIGALMSKDVFACGINAMVYSLVSITEQLGALEQFIRSEGY